MQIIRCRRCASFEILTRPPCTTSQRATPRWRHEHVVLLLYLERNDSAAMHRDALTFSLQRRYTSRCAHFFAAGPGLPSPFFVITSEGGWASW